MRVSIQDTTAEIITSQLKGNRTLDGEVDFRLQETLHAPEGRVVLSWQELEEIAERLGTGLPIRTKQDLGRAIAQTAQLHLGDTRLVFTPSQLLLIEERARKVGDTPERFVARIASKLLTDIFLIQPADEGVFYTPGFEPEDDNAEGSEAALTDGEARAREQDERRGR